MISCIIIEDQPPAQRILQKYIKESKSLELKAVFADVINAREFLDKENVALIFLDIHLPKLSGIDFLKSYSSQTEIILTTAFADYALESYEYNVVDYLLKPFSYERFMQAVEKVKTVSLQEKNKYVFIKSGYDLIQLDQNKIIYIKADGDYTEINTLDKNYLSTDTLKQWLEKLNSNFYQVHKSFIANTTQLQKISGNQLYMLNEDVLPIGRVYKKDFIEKFQENF
ncbi:two component transcriptional regulator, LytTR family [Mesonia phycicola]|uniref:Two component transcriptional regulator, LytTR family n=1 Tax=Mesonia phycicola TaxID=579105 RepID=A0A1M6H055_9FLAO|nr:LytTR family DNA-binding domain-containing protein [Mesonia phycicola]SHJ15524.1 two component transcriptional regulator, LytTR family [Mesonia phycicola]